MENLPKKISWTIPIAYSRRQLQIELKNGVNPVRLIVVTAIVLLGIGYALIHFFPEQRRDILRALAMAPLATALMITLHCLPLWLVGKSVKLKRNGFIKEGQSIVKWENLDWYQIKDVENFPVLRALETAYQHRGHDLIRSFPFDPRQIDEGTIQLFIESVAPGKFWQH